MPLIRVQARKKGVTGYINCMRGTWLGNPYPLSKYTLKESLELYEEYLIFRINQDIRFRTYLIALGDVALKDNVDVLLGCTCKPKDKCHVNILIKNISNMHYGEIVK